MGRQPRSSTLANTKTADSSSSLPFVDLSKLARKPPSLPAESDPRHVALLNRSLTQNDKEIVALEKLNDSIQTVKNIILQHFGEEAFLDMVSQPDGGISNIPEDKKEYHKILQEEFVSRMKLRRKLLNRLARRLLRISHAMDGNIMGGSTLPSVTNVSGKAGGMGIFPPALPKYGIDRNFPSEVWDLATASYALNPTKQIVEAKETIKEYVEDWSTKQEAMRRVQQRRNGGDVSSPTVKDTSAEGEKNTEINEDTPTRDTDTTLLLEQDRPSASTSSSTTNKKRKSRKETAVTETTDIRSAILAFDSLKFDQDHQADLAAIIEYNEEYERLISPTDGSIQLAITKEDFEGVIKTEDSFMDSSKQPLGIGASVRSMSARDKLTEWKRWSTELLSRIPIQPTFEDLGMENLIFGGLEERKKMARGIVDTEAVDKSETDNARGRTRSKKKKPSEDLAKRKNSMDETGEIKQNDAEEEERKPVVVKTQKWFSVQPVPSFRDQDFNTFAMIQSELLTASYQQQSRSRVQEYTDIHSRVYRRSVDLNNQKSKLEADIRNTLFAKNLELNRLRTEHSTEIAALRAQYNKDCEVYENNKRAQIHAKMQSHGHLLDPIARKALTMTERDIASRCLKGVVDRVVIRNDPSNLPPHGSGTLHNAMGSKDPTRSAVGTTLSHMVDVACNRVDSSWVTDQKLDEMQANFGPPPVYRLHPSEENILSRYEKMELDLRGQLAVVTRNLNASEIDRHQAWSKLVKAKNETDTTNAAAARKTVTMEPIKNTGAPHLSAYSLATRMPASFVAANAPTASVPSSSIAPVPVQPVLQVNTVQVPSANSSTVAAPTSNIPLKSTGSEEEEEEEVMEEESISEDIENPVASDTTTGEKQISTFQRLYGVEAVKARMAVDGSIKPVTTPKQGKDGLYVRPAGRQRKNMDWDAVNGKWIPLP
jgi:hypothetical protein